MRLSLEHDAHVSALLEDNKSSQWPAQNAKEAEKGHCSKGYEWLKIVKTLYRFTNPKLLTGHGINKGKALAVRANRTFRNRSSERINVKNILTMLYKEYNIILSMNVFYKGHF